MLTAEFHKPHSLLNFSNREFLRNLNHINQYFANNNNYFYQNDYHWYAMLSNYHLWFATCRRLYCGEWKSLYASPMIGRIEWAGAGKSESRWECICSKIIFISIIILFVVVVTIVWNILFFLSSRCYTSLALSNCIE